MLKLFFICSLLFQSYVNCANILTISPVLSHSHSTWHRILLKELYQRGHNITFVTVDYEQSSQNYTIIHFEGVYETLAKDFDLEELPDTGPYSTILFDWMIYQCKHELNTNGFKQIAQYPSNFFDLYIIDISNGIECFYPLIEKLGEASIIGTSPLGLVPWTNEYSGDWLYPAITPFYSLPYTDQMNFFQRFQNFLVTIFIAVAHRYYTANILYETIKQFYGPNVTYSLELNKNLSVILVNMDPVIGFARPMLPNVIPVGGLHVKTDEKLPQDLQHYLDEAKEGVIYFSLGSNIRSDRLSKSKQKILLETFKKLPYKVVWKWESEHLPNQPSNVLIRKWLPQCAILNHPNVKLFFTHGGELSIHETIYYQKPVIGMPFFLDQKFNLNRVVQQGFGVELDYKTITPKIVENAIYEVISNKKYIEKIQYLSKRFRDQPQTPMERAIFWIEYVMRNNGAKELQSYSVHLPFYQAYCLDIIITILVFIYIVIKIVLFMFKLILKNIFSRKENKKLKKS